MRKVSPRVATGRTFKPKALTSLIIFLAVGIVARPQEQTDWKQWTAKDVQQVLYKSPWVALCCREWDTLPPSPDAGYTASIVSSRAVRQALVRRMQMDKRYQTLDPVRRAEVDQRISACLNEKFDNYIVLSFSFNVVHDHPVFPKIYPSESYLLTSDGRKVVGQVVTDPVGPKCGAPPDHVIGYPPTRPGTDLWLTGPEHELAFPRIMDGKATIAPDDKKIRVQLDFYTKSWPGHSVAESALDFNIGKLIYQGKPDF
jgi:hypothetical protein